jgi:hypothetical protein
VVKLKKFTKPNARSWPFALVVSLVLGILVLLDNGSVDSDVVSATCRVEVTADVLSERAGPDPSTQSQKDLHRGDVLGALTEVRGGYRKLVDGNWSLNEYLRPLPGSKCAG